MANKIWEYEESEGRCRDYDWGSDDLPARKFYLFIADIGHRLRNLMTDPGAIKMIDYCEQCAEGHITENEIGEAAEKNRPKIKEENYVSAVANELYWWVADRYAVNVDTFCDGLITEIFAIAALVEAGLLRREDDWRALEPLRTHPLFTAIHDRTEREWGAIIRDIYGPDPFNPVALDPEWRTDTAVSLAKHMYESRDFSAMPILADALQDAGCDDEAVLAHCRDRDQVHVRGCWVVDLVLGRE